MPATVGRSVSRNSDPPVKIWQIQPWSYERFCWPRSVSVINGSLNSQSHVSDAGKLSVAAHATRVAELELQPRRRARWPRRTTVELNARRKVVGLHVASVSALNRRRRQLNTTKRRTCQAHSLKHKISYKKDNFPKQKYLRHTVA